MSKLFYLLLVVICCLPCGLRGVQTESAKRTRAKFFRSVKKDNTPTTSVCFSPDGSLLASGNENGQITLSPISTQTENVTFSAHKRGVKALTFWIKKSRLISCGNDKIVKIWDLKKRQPMKSLDGFSASVLAVSVAQKGGKLAAGSANGTVIIWDLRTMEKIEAYKFQRQITSLAFSSRGKVLVVGEGRSLNFPEKEEGEAIIWNLYTSKKISLKGHKKGISSVALIDNLVATASYDGSIRLWSAENGALQKAIQSDALFFGMAVSPNGKTIATADWDGTIKLWTVAGELITKITVKDLVATSLAFSPKGTKLAASFFDLFGKEKHGMVDIWVLKPNRIKKGDKKRQEKDKKR